jgi:peptide-methionine (R)-S-oxide reductase
MNDRRAFLGLAGAAGVSLLLFGRGTGAAPPMAFAVSHTAADWQKILGPQFTSPLLKEHRRGTFVCAGCANALFNSATKFESGTGWPSFWRALPHAVVQRPDHSLFMDRTEVLCARCGGHLGHVFDDGPRPTGLRYCMNGLALNFRPA